ncbi:repressor LexA [Candidatus Poribacteria bacterium]|nr:repressor LexA [Candidatus Poribacteria bacterium]
MHTNDVLSDSSRRLLEAIARHITDSKRPPTRREMMTALRYRSPRSVDYHLARLEEDGYVKRTPNAHRGIELTQQGIEASGIGTLPIIGSIAAGAPITALEEREGTLAVGEYFARLAHFVLLVRGDSMKDADILDGDYALIRRQPTAENGDIVAALIIDGSETEATIKGYYPRPGGIELRPANSEHTPIHIRGTSHLQCQVLGKVVGRVRLGATMPQA